MDRLHWVRAGNQMAFGPRPGTVLFPHVLAALGGLIAAALLVASRTGAIVPGDQAAVGCTFAVAVVVTVGGLAWARRATRPLVLDRTGPRLGRGGAWLSLQAATAVGVRRLEFEDGDVAFRVEIALAGGARVAVGREEWPGFSDPGRAEAFAAEVAEHLGLPREHGGSHEPGSLRS